MRAQAAGGYLDYHPEDDTYVLPDSVSTNGNHLRIRAH
jgi:hypothetical protein